jgi:peptide/nickel transport system substrate-binding protein
MRSTGLFIIAAVMTFLATSAAIAVSALPQGPPLIKRPMDLYEATIDYSWAYETASGEIIFNTMDTLIMFNGEHTDQFLPSIATNWTSIQINETGPEGQDWYYRYVFVIREGVLFQPPYNYSLTPQDVEYSFERTLVQDRAGGPQWMLYEPLLDTDLGAAGLGNGNLLTNASSDPANVQYVGKLLDEAVESNATCIWFNLMYPSAYAPFYNILCQTWSSIVSQQWVISQVIGSGRPDWSGDWSQSHAGWGLDHTEWLDHHNPSVSPLDNPTPMAYGSGPFQLVTVDYNNNFWNATRNVAYWRDWPADYPAMAASSPAGYVDTIHVTWNFLWGDRLNMFKSGEVDFCAVPRQYIPQLYQSPTPPYVPPNYPLDGIRCIQPLPVLACDAIFFTFTIDPFTPYGPIGPAGVFSESNIPSDFFGNATWSAHIRRAFAYAFDYDTLLQEAYLGEAQHPATAIIPGLPYNDPTVQGYTYNLAMAQQEFQAVPGLWDTGFTMAFLYMFGSRPPYVANLLKEGIESISPKFHVSLMGASWLDYLTAVINHLAPVFVMGWSADYPDPHDFALPFYHTGGIFAAWQAYSNATMDALIDQAINTPDGPARAALYKQIQQGAVDDCPSFIIDQPVGRHFERDWVVGWYYNPGYPGVYFYNLWKWYYVPESLDDSPSQPHGYNLPADLTYDGKVDIKDISAVAKAFGASYGPPINPRWVYRGDINNDRKIDIKDISYVAKLFGKISPKWMPTP